MSDHSRNDDPLRAAAQRHHDRVVAELDIGDARGRVRRSPARRPVTIVAIVAVVALVAVAWVIRPDPEVEVAVDDSTSATIDDDGDDVETSTPTTAVALTPGAPDDGKDSLQFPVSAEPSTGLVHGDTVTLTGSGFPASTRVGAVMCLREAGQDDGAQGIDACDISGVTYGDADAQGNLTMEHQVRRLLFIDGQEYDCAEAEGRCIIGVGALDDYDQSGGVAVSFDATVPLPPAPTVSVTPAGPLADGQEIVAVVTGLVPGTEVGIQQCSEGGCAYTYDAHDFGLSAASADGDGAATVTTTVWRQFGTWPTLLADNVDCAVAECWIEVYGETPANRRIPPTSLSFDPDGPVRPVPRAVLVGDEPFAPGDELRISVDADVRIDGADLCRPDAGCEWGTAATPGAAGQVWTLFTVTEEMTAYCAEECYLSFYVGTAPGEGPVLNIPAIPVAFTEG